MTRSTARAATKTVTIWPVIGKDPYTGLTYGPPITEKTTFEQGSTRQYNDSKGNAFIPRSIYWYEISANGVPKLNDAIALGDHTAVPDPINVKVVEFVKVSKLQDGIRQIDDVMVLT